MVKPSRAVTVAAAIALIGAVGLAGCGSQTPTNLPKFGNATYASVPQSAAPVATKLTIDPLVQSFLGNTVTSSATIGNRIALRGKKGLVVASVEGNRLTSAKTVTLDHSCGLPTAGDKEFVVACPTGKDKGSVSIIDANSGLAKKVTVPLAATTAVKTTNGTIVAASSTSKSIVSVGADGKVSDAFKLANPQTQLIRVKNTHGVDSLVGQYSPETKLSGIVLSKKNAAYLRIGVGVGRIAPAGDSFMLATDAAANQVMVYLTDPIIMLHQTAMTAARPWGVVWDSARKVAWVSTTGTNGLTAYSIDSGFPIAHGTLATPSTVTSLALLGHTIVATTAGHGLWIFDPDKLDIAAKAPAKAPTTPTALPKPPAAPSKK